MNCTVRVCPPPEPVTVTTNEPVGVVDDVPMVKVLEKVGKPDEGLKEHEAPDGSPLVHERLTDCDIPLNKVAEIVFDPLPPRVTVMPPEFDKEKSNPVT